MLMFTDRSAELGPVVPGTVEIAPWPEIVPLIMQDWGCCFLGMT